MRELIIPVGDDEYTGKIERVYGIRGELIRCKDCKKNDTSACAMAYWDMETGEITWWNKPDEYCSRAERKDNV